jgi:excisionase family DNA binding protein
MNARQAAEYLGMSVDAIHRLTRAGAIPGHKVRGVWLFHRDRLDRWVESDCDPDAG